MWIIRVKGVNYSWGNEIMDDFLGFLPGHFKCPKEEIEAWAVAKADEGNVHSAPDLQAIDPDSLGTKLITWPYAPNEGGQIIFQPELMFRSS